MNSSWFIAWRHIRKKRGFFVNLSSILSIGGIVVGVMALNITLAVMNGFDSDLQDKILGLQPDIIIFNQKSPIKYNEIIGKEEKLLSTFSLQLSPFISEQAIVRNENNIQGIEIKGIDPLLEGKITNFPKTVKDGEFSLSPGEILIGKELAGALNAKVGNKCNIISGAGVIKEFKVSGIFTSGMYLFDSSLAYISLTDAQKLFGLQAGQATNIGIKTKNIYKASKIASYIQADLQYPFVVRSWDQMNKNLFSAIKLEKTTMFILLGLIILVAGFGISNTMIMNIMQKVKEIGILETLGATPLAIRNIFIFEGMFLGLIGVFSGSVLGFIGSKLLEKYQFIKLPTDVYYISTLPVQIKAGDFLWIGILAFAIIFLSSIYPAHIASKIRPAEALRQE